MAKTKLKSNEKGLLPKDIRRLEGILIGLGTELSSKNFEVGNPIVDGSKVGMSIIYDDRKKELSDFYATVGKDELLSITGPNINYSGRVINSNTTYHATRLVETFRRSGYKI